MAYYRCKNLRRCCNLHYVHSLFIDHDHRLYFSADLLHSVHEWLAGTSDFFQAVVFGYLYSFCNCMIRKINEN